jgi:hypothetical protein
MQGDGQQPEAPGPPALVHLPDDQVVQAAVCERIQERDGSWWYRLELLLWTRVETGDGRLSGEPGPVTFLAPAAAVEPISGYEREYAELPTHRHPAAARRAAQRRTFTRRGLPAPWETRQ